MPVASESTAVSPLLHTLNDLHGRFAGLTSGGVADYIPELRRAVPEHFAICVATVDGYVYAVGDADVPFTIQSISKPFVYGLALADQGLDRVMKSVGVEPSGDAFNAISLEPGSGRPRNPMINAGAIATAGLVDGPDSSTKMGRTIDFLSRCAGAPLGFDEAVYRSERDTGHRNRAIAYLLRNADVLGDDVDDVLDRYFRQCSVLVTATDLAMMAATLANGGENPRTGERVVEHDYVAQMLSVMATCGMYDYAGSWLYRVGMPAKSGVAGGIIAVLPGQLGVGVFSPPLDQVGNSVRGVAVCEALSEEFGLHLLRPPVSPSAAVMSTYTLSDVSSKRRRSELEMRCLVEQGGAVTALRLQGPLVMSNTEVVLRRALEASGCSRMIVFDFHRVVACDTGAARLFERFVSQSDAMGLNVVFAGLRESGLGGLLWSSATRGGSAKFFPTIDLALEWCEDQLLADAGLDVEQSSELSLTEHPMLTGLCRRDASAIEQAVSRVSFSQGRRIISQGAAADCAYLLVAGSVSVNLTLPNGEGYRVATMGPGAVFGELALMDADPRTADVDAESDVVAYSLCITDLDEQAQAALVGQLARQLAARLRRADREIASLA
jgi:glutaminase